MRIPNALARSGLRLQTIELCIGIVGDTHAPDRLPLLPEVLYDVFDGVGLILHTGDAGALWVLDELSAVAPVVGVRGEGDHPQTAAALPARQLLTVAGQRILLYHSHLSEEQAERTEQRSEGWTGRLRRRAADATAVGADVAVFGHTHVPLTEEVDGVMLVNPGALASLTERTRQLIRTVAILTVARDGRVFVDHVDLAQPDRLFDADLGGQGYKATLERFSTSIISSDLITEWSNIYRISRGAPELFEEAMLNAAHRVWAGQQEIITRRDLLNALYDIDGLPDNLLAEFTVVLTR
jgi:hypothetical protein